MTSSGNDSWELPTPGTFVVDPDSVVRLADVDPDYTGGSSRQRSSMPFKMGTP